MRCLFVCFVAGKTTILYKFKLNETVPSIPTIGFNVETLTPVKGLTMTVWDMGGQERMRALWRMYLRGTDGKSWLQNLLLFYIHANVILYFSITS